MTQSRSVQCQRLRLGIQSINPSLSAITSRLLLHTSLKPVCCCSTVGSPFDIAGASRVVIATQPPRCGVTPAPRRLGRDGGGLKEGAGGWMDHALVRMLPFACGGSFGVTCGRPWLCVL